MGLHSHAHRFIADSFRQLDFSGWYRCVLGGSLSFGAAADLGHHVRERVQKGISAIVLDFSRMNFIDVSAVRAVETIAYDAKEDGKAVYTVGMNQKVRDMLKALDANANIVSDHVFDDRLSALKTASLKVKAT